MSGETAEGWLSKTGILGLSSTRHRRYFILHGNELRYYKNMSDVRPTGLIDLKHYRSAEKDSGKQHPYGFRIISQCKQHRSYIFYADNEHGCRYWIDAINATLDPFAGRHHSCESTTAIPDEPYSVLDKWLNKLDLNDNNNHHQLRPPTLVSSATTGSINSLKTTTTGLYQSPNLRSSRLSLESLDSIPSETTLSSSTGSRAHSSMGQNTIFTPPTCSSNCGSNSQQLPTMQYKPTSTLSCSPPSHQRNSNPLLSVTRSLSSNLKNQASHQYSQQQQEQQYPGDNIKSPTWSLNTTPLMTNNNKMPTIYPRKEWESDNLFDFDEDVMADSSKWYSTRPLPSTP
ncbi:hypothetical protein BC941DRAFT_417133 [Chlamydoabsidia padenii]|nr:hypothetical protein BC941DRAFT_417133 [Chlamydoabsidia padenii]